ncbi:MAG TPA: diacylglycerol kinase family lipid kinase [Sandaracinaceae bacterium LLY-WYZ-13_1]|nr:diacylglycerol kinase family lipid kinase [Sandaracinaceae bacterium LLY-WYZ-13_1]
MRTWILANPHAGSAEAGQALAADARSRGLEWTWCDDPDEASRLARDAKSRGVDRVVTAGGDGSVHAVVQALLEDDGGERTPALGILPLGTGNDLARSLAVPLDPTEALALVAEEARTVSIDVARVWLDGTRRWMINASAAGFAGEVDANLDQDAKRRWGPLAYIRGALRVLADLPVHDLRIDIDGKRVDRMKVVGAMVANARTIGGGLEVAPTADLEDGLLDLTLVEAGSRMELVPVGAALESGSVLSERKVRHHVGSRIVLEANPSIATNVDGELVGSIRCARFEVRPGALRVVVGPEYRRERAAAF